MSRVVLLLAMLLLAMLPPLAPHVASGSERRVDVGACLNETHLAHRTGGARTIGRSLWRHGVRVNGENYIIAADAKREREHDLPLQEPGQTDQPGSETPPAEPAAADALTVTITALPRGTVRDGAVILRPGDHIAPADLSGLTFWPEAGFNGPAGKLSYTVDDGHGSVATGSLDVEIGVAAGLLAPPSDTVIWESVRNSSDPADFDGFVRQFPASRFVADAQRRRAELIAAADDDSKSRAPPPPDSAMPATGQPQTSAAGVKTTSNVPLVPSPARSGKRDVVQFQDCPTCPMMIRIPAGGFMMGQGSHEPQSQPPHHIDIRAFALGRTPVTVAEWRVCVAAQACSLPRMRIADGRTPVHNLSWDDAGQYIAWLSKAAGHDYRLPSEAEWEYAARGGTNTRYWWGNAIGVSRANCSDCGGAQEAAGPSPVDALPANPFGLYGMLGGVAQWTADCWFPDYRGAPGNAVPRTAKTCDKRVLRGGSFRAAHDQITVTYRGNYDASVRHLANGFRVARDLE